MSKGIQDLGIGLGYVYITEPNGTDVSFSVVNNCDNLRSVIKPIAAASSSLNTNRSGFAELCLLAFRCTAAPLRDKWTRALGQPIGQPRARVFGAETWLLFIVATSVLSPQRPTVFIMANFVQ